MTKITFFLNKEHIREAEKGQVALNSLCATFPCFESLQVEWMGLRVFRGKIFLTWITQCLQLLMLRKHHH